MWSGRGKSFLALGTIVAAFVAIGIAVVYRVSGRETAPQKPMKAASARVAANENGYRSPLNPKLAATNVIVSINGKAITVADYDAFCRLQAALVEVKARAMPLAKKMDVNDYILKNAAKYFYRLIRFEAMRQVVAKALVVPSAEEIKAFEERFMEGMKVGNTRFSKFVARLPKAEGELLKARIYDEAAEEAYLKVWSTNDLMKVSEEEIDAGIRHMKELRARLNALNATNHLRAVAARDEILKKGRYFADVAKEYSEVDSDQGKMWDVVELAEFDAANPLGKWLATANAGDISEPLELDDGLCIVGVVSKETGASGELNGKDVDFYRLVRILFKIYDLPEELQDRAEIGEAILSARRNEAMQRLGKEIMAKATIAFPSGENIFRVKPKKNKGNNGKKSPKSTKKTKSAPGKAAGKAVIGPSHENIDK